MQCSKCYDKEIVGSGRTKAVSRIYLKMNIICTEGGWTYHQCPRCSTAKRQRVSFWSPGIIENVSVDEAAVAAKKAADEPVDVVGAILKIGALALLTVVVCSSDEKK